MKTRALLAIVVAITWLGPAVAQKKPKAPPEAGTKFLVSASKPGWATCDVEFRDPADALWPNYFYGRPAGDGSFVFDPSAPKVSLVLRCDRMAQKNGDQSRRLLGALMAPGKEPPAVTLSVSAIEGPRTEEVTEMDARGRVKKRKVEFFPFAGELRVGEKAVRVRGKATARWAYAKNATSPESVYLDLSFSVAAADLGVKTSTGEVRCRAGVTAYTRLPEARRGK